MELHNLLARQMNRLEVSYDTVPDDLKKWQELIEKVSKAYVEADQERYLIERSMELSSRELLDLNKKLETAQQIAGLGYWVYDRAKEKITLSKELYSLFGLQVGEPLPSFEGFMEMIHEDERSHHREVVERAFSEGIQYEDEIRMQRPEGDYRWYYIFGRPILSEESGIILTGIAMDITRRKKAEEELALLNQQLVVAARQVGMADIASITLHNIGNVLSSASVSTELLKENIEQPHYQRLFAIINMLKEKLPTISEFLTQDAKGKLIPSYLITLGEYIQKDVQKIDEEIVVLKKQIQHIKDIIGTQNNISHARGMTEKVLLGDVIESALQLSANSRKFKDIKITKDFEANFRIVVDKTKLLQALVNLIQNAKEAVSANEESTPRQISIVIQKDQNNRHVEIKVEDNGIGILEENLTKVFSFGFSTKKDGHGFGLHSSAIAANEMGGSLSVESKGFGKGATFILTLPLMVPS